MIPQLKKIKKNSNAVKFEMKSGSKTVGHIYLYVIKNDLHKNPYGLLEDLFVDENVRGQGLGTMLLGAVITEAKKRKLYKLIGTSRISRKRLHTFYEKHGFKKHGWEFRMEFMK